MGTRARQITRQQTVNHCHLSIRIRISHSFTLPFDWSQATLTMPKITTDNQETEEMLGEAVTTTLQTVARSSTRVASGGTLTDMWTKKSSTTTKTKVSKLVLSRM